MSRDDQEQLEDEMLPSTPPTPKPGGPVPQSDTAQGGTASEPKRPAPKPGPPLAPKG